MRKRKPEGAEVKEADYLTVRELCERWGVKRSAVYGWIDREQIPVLKLGFIRSKKAGKRIPRDWVEQYERKHFQRPSRKEPILRGGRNDH